MHDIAEYVHSADLITVISRLGHSETYSHSLELETALATMVQQSSNMLTSQIIRNPAGNSLFHSDFDNFISSQPLGQSTQPMK